MSRKFKERMKTFNKFQTNNGIKKQRIYSISGKFKEKERNKISNKWKILKKERKE